MFAVFQLSGTSVDCPDLSKIIEIGLAMTLASSLSTCGHVLASPMGLFIPSLLKCSLT